MNCKSVPVLWMGGAFGVALVMASAVLATNGINPKSLVVALRLTARWSFLLFWMAYATGPMAALVGPAMTPLARRGREFGLAFAAAHLIHIGLVIWLYRISENPPLSRELFVFFTIGIIWTYLLAVLSFGGLWQAIGAVAWRVVRFLGLNYILIAFAYDFLVSAIHSVTEHQGFVRVAEYVPFALISVAAPLLFFAGAARRWQARPA